MDFHYIDPTKNELEYQRCYNACLRVLEPEHFRINPSADKKYGCSHCHLTFLWPNKLVTHHA